MKSFDRFRRGANAICLLALLGCSENGKGQASLEQKRLEVSQPPILGDARFQECNSAAKKLLGARAQVLACGQLSHSGELEVLTIVGLGGFKKSEMGIPASKFAILRKGSLEWTTELVADDKPVRNSVGFIGATFIDDSYSYSRYRIIFSGGGAKDKEALSLVVRFIDPDGETEAWPLEINWNPSAKRFQEYSESDSPLGFKAENKNPKHIRSKSK